MSKKDKKIKILKTELKKLKAEIKSSSPAPGKRKETTAEE
jgi:hypothetical protein